MTTAQGTTAEAARDLHAADREERAARPVIERWRGAGAGRHYRGARWRNARARARDVETVGALCRRSGVAPTSVLDVGCGTGRLAGAFVDVAYAGVDASGSMLAEHPRAARLVQASALALPFPDAAFDLAVASRLLHHFAPTERRRIVAELARVAARYVVASIFDRASWPGWRRRLGWRRGDSRRPIGRAELASDLRGAGFEVVRWRASLRFVSMQTFVLARRADLG